MRLNPDAANSERASASGEYLQQVDGFCRIRSTDGRACVAGRKHSPFLREQKLGWLNVIPTFFPPGPDAISIRPRHAISHGETEFSCHGERILLAIHGARVYRSAQRFELGKAFFVAG